MKTLLEPSAAARTADEGGSPVVLGAALLGFFLITLDALIVTVALPDIGRSLDVGMSGLQWVVDGYTLIFAALMLSAGALSDRIGARQAFGGGLVLFALASAACGFAPGLGLLVAARLVQGAAAAVVMPASLALVRQGFRWSHCRCFDAEISRKPPRCDRARSLQGGADRRHRHTSERVSFYRSNRPRNPASRVPTVPRPRAYAPPLMRLAPATTGRDTGSLRHFVCGRRLTWRPRSACAIKCQLSLNLHYEPS